MPRISLVTTQHSQINLSWIDSGAVNVIRYRIYRDTFANPTTLIDSVAFGTSTYTDNNVANNKLYYYRVKAVNSFLLTSSYSNERRAIPLDTAILLNPTNNSFNQDLHLTLRWRKYAFATKYRIQVYQDSIGGSIFTDSITTDTSFQFIPSLLYNRLYFWRIQHLDTLGFSNFSHPYIFQTQLSAPVLVSLTNTSQQVRLTWTHNPVYNVKGYIIYRGVSIGSMIPLDTVPAGIFDYVDTKVNNNNTYYYKVIAFNTQQISSPTSNIKSIIPYALPSTFNGAQGPWKSILSWNPVSQSTVKFQLFKGTSPSTKSLLADSLTSFSYIDTSVIAGTPYYYALRCFDTQGNFSEFSSDQMVIPNRIWYVSKSGNNGNNGSINSSLQTISAAIALSKTQDTLLLNSGIYNERVQFIAKESTIASAYILNANQNLIDSVVIDGTGLGVAPLISDNQNKSFFLRGITIRNASQIAISSVASTTSEVQISNCVISNSGSSAINGVVSLYNGQIIQSRFINCQANNLLVIGNGPTHDKVWVDRCKFTNNSVTGAIIVSQTGRISNCLIFKNNGASMLSHNLSAATSDTSLWAYHNTIVNNIGDGITVGGSPISIIDNNIVAYNTGSISYAAQIFFANIYIRNNIIPGLGSKSIPGTFTVVKQLNSEINPHFTDSVAGNFTLTNYSNGIGKAHLFYHNGYDMDNNIRPYPVGSNPDIGAYENPYGLQSAKLDSINSTSSGITLFWSVDSGSYSKFRIFRDTVSNPIIQIDSTSGTTLTYTDNNVAMQKRYFYRLSSVGALNTLSGLSNTLHATKLEPPVLVLPVDNKTNQPLNTIFNWKKNVLATKYRWQLSSDKQFLSQVFYDSIRTDTFIQLNNLTYNTTFFWRVQSIDTTGYSGWSSVFAFQTVLHTPVLLQPQTVSRRIQLNWSDSSSGQIAYYKIYRDTVPNNLKLIDSINGNTFIDSVPAFNKIYYYQIAAVNTSGKSSLLSNITNTVSLAAPTLLYPSDKQTKVPLNTRLKWSNNPYATFFRIRIYADSAQTIILKDSILTDTSLQNHLMTRPNVRYWWDVQALDSFGISLKSKVQSFQNELLTAIIDTIISGNHKNTIYWSYSDTSGIEGFMIYRTDSSFINPLNVSKITNNMTRTYTDTGLINNNRVYYIVTAFNHEQIESGYSNAKWGSAFNLPPIAAKLKDVFYPNRGRTTSVIYKFSATGTYDPDGRIDSLVWYVNNTRIVNDSILQYNFRQGTSLIVLKAFDNDRATDSSYAFIHINLFERTLNGPIMGGLTAGSENSIYVNDGQFNIGTGEKLIKIDTLGNISPDFVRVSDKIQTTPSITPSKALLISNGTYVNGYTSSGISLFNKIDLGGTAVATPTVDSLLARCYVGVENRNFFAIDYNKGGSIAWSFKPDAPIIASAVLTSDRKLIFPDASGKLYGFNVRNQNSQGSSPKWTFSISDSVVTSPAIDTAGNIYIGTISGKIYKVDFKDDGTVATFWNTPLGSRISASPVIDAKGYIYASCSNGQFVKLNPITGAIIWKFQTGASINSTPAISNYGIIYIANEKGLLIALDTTSKLKWYYKDSTAIDANILHISGTTYIGTKGGKVMAFWDKDLKTFGKAENTGEPVWGTFQGNGQRTGAQPGPIDTLQNDTSHQGLVVSLRPHHQVDVFPNPASEQLTIRSTKVKVISVSLVGLDGKEIVHYDTHSDGHNDDTTISIGDIQSGVYILQIETDTGIEYVRCSIVH